MCMWKIVYLGGICIKRNIINSLLIIFTLFLCMSLVGAACAAEDVSLNNDATNGIDDVLGTTSDSSDVASVNEGSLLDNSQTGDILSTTHDLSGSTFDDIQRYLNNNVAEVKFILGILIKWLMFMIIKILKLEKY